MAGSCAWLLVMASAGRQERRKEGSADFGLVLSTFILFGRLKVFNNFQNFKFFFNFKNFSKVQKFYLVRKRLYKYLSVTPRTTLVSVDKFDCLSREVKKGGERCLVVVWFFKKFSLQ
jgi:hypothetical protein